MAWIKVVKKLGEYSKDTEVEIEFCWGNRATRNNTSEAKVFVNALREGLKEKDLSKIATAFNVPCRDIKERDTLLIQFVGLLEVLWNFDILRKAKWSGLNKVRENER